MTTKINKDIRLFRTYFMTVETVRYLNFQSFMIQVRIRIQVIYETVLESLAYLNQDTLYITRIWHD